MKNSGRRLSRNCLATELGLAALWAIGAAGCSSGGAEDALDEKVLSPESTSVADNEDSLNLVAQIGLRGRVIKFFKPSPGELLQIETGVMADIRVDPREARLWGSALYTYLTGQAAPQSLLDAEALAMPPEGLPDGSFESEGSTETPAASGLSLRPQTARYVQNAPIDREVFLDAYCTKTDRFFKAIFATWDSWGSGPGINMMQAGVFVDFGTVDYQGHFGITDFYASLPMDHYTGWRYTSGGNGVSAKSAAYPQVDPDPMFTSMYDHCINYHY
jgi:hypothetical protein